MQPYEFGPYWTERAGGQPPPSRENLKPARSQTWVGVGNPSRIKTYFRCRCTARKYNLSLICKPLNTYYYSTHQDLSLSLLRPQLYIYDRTIAPSICTSKEVLRVLHATRTPSPVSGPRLV